jgi:hypothetical protein
MKVAPLLVILVTASTVPLLACDKAEPATDKPAASAAPSAPAPAPPPPPAETATAPAPAASAPAPSGPTKDVVAAVFDPATEHQRTVKVLAGGSVALYVPEWAGTSWKVAQQDGALGKPKEETIPGFAGPTTPAHAFTWQIKGGLKGETKKVSLTNSAKGQPSGPSFALSIEVS